MGNNKEDGRNLLGIAKFLIYCQDYETAELALVQSVNIYPTTEAIDLLAEVREKLNSEGTNEGKAPDQKEPKSTKPNGNENGRYSGEVSDETERIISCVDYYEMLGVSRDATDVEIKKAFKKLALQVHPDKNSSDGALEAFKALGNAAEVLTDPEKRRKYDASCSNDFYKPFTSSANDFPSFRARFKPDVTAEEVLKAFFGPEIPPQSDKSAETDSTPIFISSIAFFILVLWLLSLMVENQTYSMQSNGKFQIQKHTMKLRIPYFVADTFDNDYVENIKNLEVGIEEEYMGSLRNACYKESIKRDQLINEARSRRDIALIRELKSTELPSCDLLSRMLKIYEAAT